MRLVRFGEPGSERPGVILGDGSLRDVSGAVGDFSGPTLSHASIAALRACDLDGFPRVDSGVPLACPLADVPNFFCIGLNYAAHAAETGASTPAEPLIFSKASSALAGPNDPIVIPAGAETTDWEVELGVVIGADVWRVAEADALGAIAGYCTINDVSERDWQKNRGGQWIKGKSAPSYGKVGPWIVTADRVRDPQALTLHTDLNGERVQDSHTGDMIFGVAQLISYMSRMFRLRPGDIIATGTPSGVGLGMTPPRFLRPGDRLSMAVEGLGEQSCDVIAEDA